MNYYDLLGVHPKSNNEEIRAAFLELSKKYHPDVNPARNANYLFIQIKLAYDTLSNPVTRQKYDTGNLHNGSNHYKDYRESKTSYHEHKEKQTNKEKSESHYRWENTNSEKGTKSDYEKLISFLFYFFIVVTLIFTFLSYAISIE